MPLTKQRALRMIQLLTIIAITVMVVCNAAMVLFPLKPFWVDEWRIIYNLKFKTAQQLWGPLDFMQQFPRAYLWILKQWVTPLGYSYFSFRLPSFLVATTCTFFCYRLMNRIYERSDFNRFLFVLILVSSFTYTEYYVQIKQYSMDILLSLVAIAQLLQLMKISAEQKTSLTYYVILCLSFAIVPFFSYTYPIAAGPVYMIALFQSRYIYRSTAQGYRTLLKLWIPLLLGIISIVCFYKLDIHQVSHDPGMQLFWAKNMMPAHSFSPAFFFRSIYLLFSQVGSGDLFAIVFGIVGCAAFIWSLFRAGHWIRQPANIKAQLQLYSFLVCIVTILLFTFRKLPVESRLNIYTVPAIAILIISLLGQLQNTKARKISLSLSAILYLGVTGNIFTTYINDFTGASYAKKLHIYQSTQSAVQYATVHHTPMLITPGVAYPYEHTLNYPYNDSLPGTWILQAFPAYKVNDTVPVYALHSLDSASYKLLFLPANVKQVLAGDGSTYRLITR